MTDVGDYQAQLITSVPGSWFNLILSAAKYYLSCSDDDRRTASKLIVLGRKHGKDFLGLPPSPLFGLLEHGSYVSLLRTQEDKIAFLRKTAEKVVDKLGLNHTRLFIRYSHCYTGTPGIYEYASAVPWIKKRKRGQLDQVEGHSRWLYAGDELRPTTDENYKARLSRLHGDNAKIPVHPILNLHQREIMREEYESRKRWLWSQNETVFDQAAEEVEDYDPQNMGIFWNSSCTLERESPWFKLLYGDYDSAALFFSEGSERLMGLSWDINSDSHELYSLFENNMVSDRAVAHKLAADFHFMAMGSDPHLKSLKWISTAAMLYKDKPHASIDIRVLRQKLYQVPWMESKSEPIPLKRYNEETLQALKPYVLDRASAFACLTFFESGIYCPDPSQLSNVMAMSSGNSLYVAAELMCDPLNTPPPDTIRHVLGNIGRPGVVFLIPPVDPLISSTELSDWESLEHEQFEGAIRDSFSHITLHLSFTSAISPLNIRFSGAQDTELYMLETVISVHDKGKWIADLDICKSLGSSKVRRLDRCQSHACKETLRYRMTCIDNWLELLDPSNNPLAIFQAHENWQARLAAVALSTALGNGTLILPHKTCWTCFEDLVSNLNFNLPSSKQVVVVA